MRSFSIAYLVAVLALAVGWVINIFKIFNSDFSNIDGELVLRVVGVFVAPIGGIIGYF